jgi:AraC-like DNA-binding protein
VKNHKQEEVRMGFMAVEKVVDYIHMNYMEKISTTDLELISGVSRFTLARKFRCQYGQTPINWLWSYRLRLAADLLLKEPNWSCSAIAYHCGFDSPAHFSRKFKYFYGFAPGKYRGLLSHFNVQTKTFHGKEYDAQASPENTCTAFTARIQPALIA